MEQEGQESLTGMFSFPPLKRRAFDFYGQAKEYFAIVLGFCCEKFVH
jgi:hypothetical protein